MNKYWQIVNKATDSAEILIYEQIGKNFWDDSGVDAKGFVEELKALGNVKNITLRINSAGGSVFEGLAIYNCLAAHPADITVHIDGLAASIASVIAMAGDKVIMPENALMMIHDPYAMMGGNADEMRKMADMLDKIKSGLISAYRNKTGLPDEEIAGLMSAETWLTAAEAKDKGFIDETVGAVKIAASFDLSAYKNVPAAIMNQVNSRGNGAETPPAVPATPPVNQEVNPIKNKEVKKMELEQARNEGMEAEKKRAADILAMGEKHKCLDLAKKAVNDGVSVDDFKDTVLQRVYDARPAEAVRPEIGMSDAEANGFSIVRAIRNIAEFKPLDGLEREASEAAAKVARREPKGFFIPHDVMKRSFNKGMVAVMNALSAGDNTKGGFLIGTDVRTGDMIELLRNKSLVSQLGARTLSGLVGNVAIPRVTGGATAYWLPENGAVTPSDQSFGQLGLVPHRLVGDTAYSKELVMQTSPDVEGFVRDDLMRVLAIARDLSAINGLGANGEPLGILNTTGIGSVTFGAAATWAKAIDFETQVANANADLGSMAYLTTPAVRGKWKGAPKVTNYPSFLWEGGQNGSGIVNGYRAEATKQVPGDKVIFGSFSDLILADWAGVDVVVDPYSLKKTGQIEVTITIWADNGVRHPASFCVSTDSGAQ